VKRVIAGARIGSKKVFNVLPNTQLFGVDNNQDFQTCCLCNLANAFEPGGLDRRARPLPY
jgi:hypothetical protein